MVTKQIIGIGGGGNRAVVVEKKDGTGNNTGNAAKITYGIQAYVKDKKCHVSTAYDEIPGSDKKTRQDSQKVQKSNNGFGEPFDDAFPVKSIQLKLNEGYFVAEERASRY